jgi:hypothetical protein
MKTILELIALVIIVVILWAVAYAISVSDLPEWFKFFLLS